MSIDDLNFGEIKGLIKLFGGTDDSSVSKTEEHGCCVIILDKGFIYVGDLSIVGKYIEIKRPMNLRSFDSSKGLLWHAENGKEDTTLDSFKSGAVKAPLSSLEHFIPTKSELWYS